MRTRTLLPALLALVLVPSAAAQVTRIGPSFGWHSDWEEVSLGLNGHFGIDTGDREFIVGVVAELVPFRSGESITFIDADLLVPANIGSLQLYGGGGLTVRYRKPEVADADTDVGLNLKGGMVLDSDSRAWAPFVELVQTIGADTEFTTRAGVFFHIGR